MPSRSGATHVIPLAAAEDVARAGAKAASLARAAREGHRVPVGFVVTTGAPAQGLDAIAGAVREWIDALGGGRFAVRSSAVGEDGRERSFAGQLETELDVEAASVPAAIERAWASVRAARALRYGAPGPMAVLVQPMIAADRAGVAFSADPRTGERGVVLVEAVRGLGDALVSGAQDPEAWRVGEGTERVRATAEPVLTEAQASEVAALARAMEALFGAPQDIEWAFEGEVLHLLQSRPITALPAAPIPIPIEVPAGTWERDDHHAVLSPLGWAWFQPYPRAMAEAMASIGMPIEAIEPARIGGHLYTRMVMKGGDSEKVPPRWALWLAARLVPALRKANREAARFLDEERYLDAFDQWEREVRPGMRARVDELFVEDPRALSDEALLARIDEALAFSATGLRHHAQLGAPIFAIGRLALFVEDHLGWSADVVHTLIAGASRATTELHRQLEAIVREHPLEGELPRSWAGLAREHPALAAQLDAWLADNRLRMLHYDPKHPTLGERPEYVLSIVEGIVHARREAAPASASDERDARMAEAQARLSPERFAELERRIDHARRAHALRDENGVETVSRPAGLLRHFVLELGRRIEGEIGAREHAVYLEPSEHAPALRGELPDVAARIARRRGEESWAEQHRGPRHYGPPPAPMPPADAFPSGMGRMLRILAWMDACERAPAASDGELLRGFGLGARVVSGRARVLRQPAELSALRHGEIVVCRITSAEWSVGLGRVAAIVTNEGGLLSHPAIIAREMGIPAVIGAAGATDRIRTGDMLRVDPVAGTVAIIPR